MVAIASTPEAKPASGERIFVLRGVRWATYKALMADVGDSRAWRMAYDGEILEFRMPLFKHEVPKRLLESFVEAIADEIDIEVLKAGSLLLEREDLTRAIEPDGCFYIQNESRVRSNDNIDLPEDPPLDLAIESDYTSSSLNKFNIYASIGVPELWRYRNGRLEVYQLVEGKYERVELSLSFPFLPIAEIPHFIEQSKSIGQRAAVRLFREQIRETLVTYSE